MINVAEIPVIDGDMSALRGHAMMIAVAGTGYIDTGARVHTTWQTLRPHYTAPETGQLLAATGPVATVSRQVGENLQQARDVLTVYADTVETIQGELDLLRTRAGDVNSAITAAGEDWRSDHDLVGRHNAVLDAISVQAVAFIDAQRVCVNGLRALHGQAPLAADNGDGVIDPATEFGYTLDQYRAVAAADPDQGGGLPWGGVAEPDHPWYVDVATAPVRFVGGLGDAVVNTAIGLGALVGYDHSTGEFTGATAGAAWTNVGKLALAATTYLGPGGAIRDQLGTVPFLEPGEAGRILTDTGKALIAYDQWDDDPARAAGNAVGNIALAIVGTKGAGAGLRGIGAALQLTRHGGIPARTGAGFVRAGEAIGRIPTLTELAGTGWRRLHPALPDTPTLPDTPAVADAPPVPAPRGPGTGTLADDLAPRPPRGDHPVDPDPGPGARPEPVIRSPEGNRPPPDTDAAARPVTAAADDPPSRRPQDDDSAIDEADTTAPDRDLVTAGARPPVAHANGADPVPRLPDAEGPLPSRSGDAASGPEREGPSRGEVVPDDIDRSPAENVGQLSDPSSATPASLDGAPSAHSPDGVDQRGGDIGRHDDGANLRADTDLPHVTPGHRVLGTLDESRVVRDPSGVITEVDGTPIGQYLAEVSQQRAEAFRSGRDARLFTGNEIGQVTSTAIDSRAGALAEGTNSRIEDVVARADLHPVLAERLARAEAGPGHPIINRNGTTTPGRQSFPAPYDPLNHAEVKAINDLLWLRGANASPQALRDMRIDNYFPLGGDGVRRAPCCASCTVMLDGVDSNAGRFRGFPPGPHNFEPG